MAIDVQWANFWVNVILALITLLAVLVALFGKWLWDRVNKPIIVFKVKNAEPHRIQSSGYGGTLLWYFRLEVKNIGKTLAKNCYIKINKVYTEEGASVEYFEPDKLKWSNSSRDMRYRDDPPNIWEEARIQNIPNLIPIFKENEDVSPGDSEFCDLFWTRGDKEIVFISKGRRPRYSINKENYIVEIEIFGDNLEPKKGKFRISSFEDFPLVKVNWVKNN